MSLRDIRQAVSIVLRDGEAHVPPDHVALVLLALDSLHLLDDLDEDAEAYVARVKAARREALYVVSRERTLRVVPPPD